MARFDTSFDATSVEPTTAQELLPAGKYRAQIVESEMRVTKNGMGQFLWLMLDILDGEYKGRKIFDQLNLVNRNEQTVEIAQRTLSAICHAVGQVHVSDSEQLHFKPLAVTLKVEPAGNDKYGVYREARNKVAGYSAANAGAASGTALRPAAPGPRPAAAAPPPAARTGAAASPPWRRNA